MSEKKINYSPRARQNDVWEEYIVKKNLLKVRKARYILDPDPSHVGHYIPDPDFTGPDDDVHGTYWNEVVLMRPKTINVEGKDVAVGVGRSADETFLLVDDPNTKDDRSATIINHDDRYVQGSQPSHYKLYKVLPPTRLNIADTKVDMAAPVIEGYPEYTDAMSVATDTETGEVTTYPAQVTTKRALMASREVNLGRPFDALEDDELMLYTQLNQLKEGHEYSITAVVINAAGDGYMDNIDVNTCSIYEVGRTRVVDAQKTAVNVETTILRGKPEYDTKRCTVNKGMHYDPSAMIPAPLVEDWIRSKDNKGFRAIPKNLEEGTWYFIRLEVHNAFGLYISPGFAFRTKGGGGDDWELADPSIYEIRETTASVVAPYYKGKYDATTAVIQIRPKGVEGWVDLHTSKDNYAFRTNIEGLQPATTYEVRSHVIDTEGHEYNSVIVEFTTKGKPGPTPTDWEIGEPQIDDVTIDHARVRVPFKRGDEPYIHMHVLYREDGETEWTATDPTIREDEMEYIFDGLKQDTTYYVKGIIEFEKSTLESVENKFHTDQGDTHALYVDDVQVAPYGSGKYQALLDGHSNFVEFKNLQCEWYEGTPEGGQKFLKLSSATFIPETKKIKGDYIYPFEEGKVYSVRLNALDTTTKQNVYSNWVEFKGRYIPFVKVASCDFEELPDNLVRINGKAESNLWLWSGATASVYMWYKEKWMCLGNYGNCEFDQETGDITFQTIPFTPVGVKFYVQLDVNLTDKRTISAEPFYFEYKGDEHKMTITSLVRDYKDGLIDMEGDINFDPEEPYNRIHAHLFYINPETSEEELVDLQDFKMDGRHGKVTIKPTEIGKYKIKVYIMEGRGVQPTLLAETDTEWAPEWKITKAKYFQESGVGIYQCYAYPPDGKMEQNPQGYFVIEDADGNHTKCMPNISKNDENYMLSMYEDEVPSGVNGKVRFELVTEALEQYAADEWL